MDSMNLTAAVVVYCQVIDWAMRRKRVESWAFPLSPQVQWQWARDTAGGHARVALQLIRGGAMYDFTHTPRDDRQERIHMVFLPGHRVAIDEALAFLSRADRNMAVEALYVGSECWTATTQGRCTAILWATCAQIMAHRVPFVDVLLRHEEVFGTEAADLTFIDGPVGCEIDDLRARWLWDWSNRRDCEACRQVGLSPTECAHARCPSHTVAVRFLNDVQLVCQICQQYPLRQCALCGATYMRQEMMRCAGRHNLCVDCTTGGRMTPPTRREACCIDLSMSQGRQLMSHKQVRCADYAVAENDAFNGANRPSHRGTTMVTIFDIHTQRIMVDSMLLPRSETLECASIHMPRGITLFHEITYEGIYAQVSGALTVDRITGDGRACVLVEGAIHLDMAQAARRAHARFRITSQVRKEIERLHEHQGGPICAAFCNMGIHAMQSIHGAEQTADLVMYGGDRPLAPRRIINIQCNTGAHIGLVTQMVWTSCAGTTTAPTVRMSQNGRGTCQCCDNRDRKCCIAIVPRPPHSRAVRARNGQIYSINGELISNTLGMDYRGGAVSIEHPGLYYESATMALEDHPGKGWCTATLVRAFTAPRTRATAMKLAHVHAIQICSTCFQTQEEEAARYWSALRMIHCVSATCRTAAEVALANLQTATDDPPRTRVQCMIQALRRQACKGAEDKLCGPRYASTTEGPAETAVRLEMRTSYDGPLIIICQPTDTFGQICEQIVRWHARVGVNTVVIGIRRGLTALDQHTTVAGADIQRTAILQVRYKHQRLRGGTCQLHDIAGTQGQFCGIIPDNGQAGDGTCLPEVWHCPPQTQQGFVDLHGRVMHTYPKGFVMTTPEGHQVAVEIKHKPASIGIAPGQTIGVLQATWNATTGSVDATQWPSAIVNRYHDLENMRQESRETSRVLRNYADICTGIGGARIAIDHLVEQRMLPAMQCVYRAEIDDFANDVYDLNFGNGTPAYNLHDTIQWPGAPRGSDARVDVAAVTPACEPFAAQGEKRGMGDDRASVIQDICIFIKATLPTVVILEEVLNFLAYPAAAALLNILVNTGYCVRWTCRNAQAYGTQWRRRVIFVAIRGRHTLLPPPPERAYDSIRLQTNACLLRPHQGHEADRHDAHAPVEGARRAPQRQTQYRFLHPRESLALQMFPRDHYIPAIKTINARFRGAEGDTLMILAWRAIGKAVPPPMIIEAILQVLQTMDNSGEDAVYASVLRGYLARVRCCGTHFTQTIMADDEAALRLDAQLHANYLSPDMVPNEGYQRVIRPHHRKAHTVLSWYAQAADSELVQRTQDLQGQLVDRSDIDLACDPRSSTEILVTETNGNADRIVASYRVTDQLNFGAIRQLLGRYNAGPRHGLMIRIVVIVAQVTGNDAIHPVQQSVQEAQGWKFYLVTLILGVVIGMVAAQMVLCRMTRRDNAPQGREADGCEARQTGTQHGSPDTKSGDPPEDRRGAQGGSQSDEATKNEIDGSGTRSVWTPTRYGRRDWQSRNEGLGDGETPPPGLRARSGPATMPSSEDHCPRAIQNAQYDEGSKSTEGCSDASAHGPQQDPPEGNADERGAPTQDDEREWAQVAGISIKLQMDRREAIMNMRVGVQSTSAESEPSSENQDEEEIRGMMQDESRQWAIAEQMTTVIRDCITGTVTEFTALCAFYHYVQAAMMRGTPGTSSEDPASLAEHDELQDAIHILKARGRSWADIDGMQEQIQDEHRTMWQNMVLRAANDEEAPQRRPEEATQSGITIDEKGSRAQARAVMAVFERVAAARGTQDDIIRYIERPFRIMDADEREIQSMLSEVRKEGATWEDIRGLQKYVQADYRDAWMAICRQVQEAHEEDARERNESERRWKDARDRRWEECSNGEDEDHARSSEESPRKGGGAVGVDAAMGADVWKPESSAARFLARHPTYDVLITRGQKAEHMGKHGGQYSAGPKALAKIARRAPECSAIVGPHATEAARIIEQGGTDPRHGDGIMVCEGVEPNDVDSLVVEMAMKQVHRYGDSIPEPYDTGCIVEGLHPSKVMAIADKLGQSMVKGFFTLIFAFEEDTKYRAQLVVKLRSVLHPSLMRSIIRTWASAFVTRELTTRGGTRHTRVCFIQIVPQAHMQDPAVRAPRPMRAQSGILVGESPQDVVHEVSITFECHTQHFDVMQELLAWQCQELQRTQPSARVLPSATPYSSHGAGLLRMALTITPAGDEADVGAAIQQTAQFMASRFLQPHICHTSEDWNGNSLVLQTKQGMFIQTWQVMATMQPRVRAMSMHNNHFVISTGAMDEPLLHLFQESIRYGAEWDESAPPHVYAVRGEAWVSVANQPFAAVQAIAEITCDTLSTFCPRFQIVNPPATLSITAWYQHINTILGTRVTNLRIARVRNRTGAATDAIVFEVPARENERILQMVEDHREFSIPLCQGQDSEEWEFQFDHFTRDLNMTSTNRAPLNKRTGRQDIEAQALAVQAGWASGPSGHEDDDSGRHDMGFGTAVLPLAIRNAVEDNSFIAPIGRGRTAGTVNTWQQVQLDALTCTANFYNPDISLAATHSGVWLPGRSQPIALFLLNGMGWKKLIDTPAMREACRAPHTKPEEDAMTPWAEYRIRQGTPDQEVHGTGELVPIAQTVYSTLMRQIGEGLNGIWNVMSTDTMHAYVLHRQLPQMGKFACPLAQALKTACPTVIRDDSVIAVISHGAMPIYLSVHTDQRTDRPAQQSQSPNEDLYCNGGRTVTAAHSTLLIGTVTAMARRQVRLFGALGHDTWGSPPTIILILNPPGEPPAGPAHTPPQRASQGQPTVELAAPPMVTYAAGTIPGLFMDLDPWPQADAEGAGATSFGSELQALGIPAGTWEQAYKQQLEALLKTVVEAGNTGFDFLVKFPSVYALFTIWWMSRTRRLSRTSQSTIALRADQIRKRHVVTPAPRWVIAAIQGEHPNIVAFIQAICKAASDQWETEHRWLKEIPIQLEALTSSKYLPVDAVRFQDELKHAQERARQQAEAAQAAAADVPMQPTQNDAPPSQHGKDAKGCSGPEVAPQTPPAKENGAGRGDKRRNELDTPADNPQEKKVISMLQRQAQARATRAEEAKADKPRSRSPTQVPNAELAGGEPAPRQRRDTTHPTAAAPSGSSAATQAAAGRGGRRGRAAKGGGRGGSRGRPCKDINQGDPATTAVVTGEPKQAHILAMWPRGCAGLQHIAGMLSAAEIDLMTLLVIEDTEGIKETQQLWLEAGRVMRDLDPIIETTPHRVFEQEGSLDRFLHSIPLDANQHIIVYAYLPLPQMHVHGMATVMNSITMEQGAPATLLGLIRAYVQKARPKADTQITAVCPYETPEAMRKYISAVTGVTQWQDTDPHASMIISDRYVIASTHQGKVPVNFRYPPHTTVGALPAGTTGFSGQRRVRMAPTRMLPVYGEDRTTEDAWSHPMTWHPTQLLYSVSPGTQTVPYSIRSVDCRPEMQDTVPAHIDQAWQKWHIMSAWRPYPEEPGAISDLRKDIIRNYRRNRPDVRPPTTYEIATWRDTREALAADADAVHRKVVATQMIPMCIMRAIFSATDGPHGFLTANKGQHTAPIHLKTIIDAWAIAKAATQALNMPHMSKLLPHVLSIYGWDANMIVHWFNGAIAREPSQSHMGSMCARTIETIPTHERPKRQTGTVVAEILGHKSADDNAAEALNLMMKQLIGSTIGEASGGAVGEGQNCCAICACGQAILSMDVRDMDAEQLSQWLQHIQSIATANRPGRPAGMANNTADPADHIPSQLEIRPRMVIAWGLHGPEDYPGVISLQLKRYQGDKAILWNPQITCTRGPRATVYLLLVHHSGTANGTYRGGHWTPLWRPNGTAQLTLEEVQRAYPVSVHTAVATPDVGIRLHEHEVVLLQSIGAQPSMPARGSNNKNYIESLLIVLTHIAYTDSKGLEGVQTAIDAIPSAVRDIKYPDTPFSIVRLFREWVRQSISATAHDQAANDFWTHLLHRFPEGIMALIVGTSATVHGVHSQPNFDVATMFATLAIRLWQPPASAVVSPQHLNFLPQVTFLLHAESLSLIPLWTAPVFTWPVTIRGARDAIIQKEATWSIGEQVPTIERAGRHWLVRPPNG